MFVPNSKLFHSIFFRVYLEHPVYFNNPKSKEPRKSVSPLLAGGPASIMYDFPFEFFSLEFLFHFAFVYLPQHQANYYMLNIKLLRSRQCFVLLCCVLRYWLSRDHYCITIICCQGQQPMRTQTHISSFHFDLWFSSSFREKTTMRKKNNNQKTNLISCQKTHTVKKCLPQ